MSDMTSTEKKRRLILFSLLGVALAVSILLASFFLFSPEKPSATANLTSARTDAISGKAGGEGSEEYNQKLKEHDTRLANDALKSGDGETYMRLMNESGRSSEQLLNNIVTSATGDTKLAQGLERSRRLLEGKGAWRVHGGGFAGCVQALMPTDFFPEYKRSMEQEFGAGSCIEINIM